jgi:hypothetical protein
MATYSESNLLAVVNGSRTTTGVLYTCPANRYAIVSLRVRDNCYCTVDDGIVASDSAGSDSVQHHNQIILDAGQTIQAVIAGSGYSSYTALEYSKP